MYISWKRGVWLCRKVSNSVYTHLDRKLDQSKRQISAICFSLIWRQNASLRNMGASWFQRTDLHYTNYEDMKTDHRHFIDLGPGQGRELWRPVTGTWVALFEATRARAATAASFKSTVSRLGAWEPELGLGSGLTSGSMSPDSDGPLASRLIFGPQLQTQITELSEPPQRPGRHKKTWMSSKMWGHCSES